MFNNDISIDLGTATVLVYIKNKGIVLREPTVIAVNTKTNEVCAVGKDALAMLGRTPPHIQAVRPLIDGVISNLTLTQEMIKHFFSKIFSRTIGHPRIMMCVPSGVTDVEQRAGFDISRPHGTMVVDIGGGTTDIAVLSLGGIVVSRSLKIAGDEFNEAIIRYMRKEMGMIIGPRTAERIKMEIGGVIPRSNELLCKAKGISVLSGLPKEVTISSNDLYPAFDDFVYNMTERIKEVLEETPPELHGDIIQDGIIMTGGGSLIYGLDKRISDDIGVKVVLAPDIIDCVAKGAGIALDNIDTVTEPTHIFHKKAYIRD